MHSETLIQTLIDQTSQIIKQAEQLKNLDVPTLRWKASPESWSILECMEHLNLYGNFYVPQIECKVSQSNTRPETEFSSGWLGSYFAKSMLPKERLNKMKTFQDKNPLHANLDKDVIDRFIVQQRKLLELLIASRRVSLNKVKISTSISTLLKMNLGDTFQFYINHIIRHFAQIERIRKEMKSA